MLIRNLRLIDGVDVRIHDGRFAEIGPGLDGDGEELDAGGATAIPGLIDAHTHLTLDATRRHGHSSRRSTHRSRSRRRKRRSAPSALLGYGVTTAREVGGVGPLSPGLRDSIASGSARGPRIFSAGAWITEPEGHG